MPWWYTTIKSGKYLNVAPWDLVGDFVPRWLWQDWALIAQAADANAETYFHWKAKRDQEFHARLGMN